MLPPNPSCELKSAVRDIAFPFSWRHTTKTKSRFQKIANFPDSDFKDYGLCEVLVELECFSRASSYATQTMLSENSLHPLTDLSSGAHLGPLPCSDTMASPTHPVPSESFPVSLAHRLPPHTLLPLSNKCLCMAPSPGLQIFCSLDATPGIPHQFSLVSRNNLPTQHP